MIPITQEQPGGRQPAPEQLRVVQQFVNSVDLEANRDNLADLASAAAWLRGLGLTTDTFDEDAQLIAIRLREGIRDLIDARDDTTHPASSAFSDTVDMLGLVVRIRDGAPRFVGTISAAAIALAPIVDAIRTAIDDGTWLRLKVCERDVCRWLFYDHSKNHASRWCASSICGSREKSRRAYARRSHHN